MKARKKKNQFYRKVIKSMIESRHKQKSCPAKCVEFNKQFITHNACTVCPCFLTSPYHQDYIKNKTFKRLKADIKFCCDEAKWDL